MSKGRIVLAAVPEQVNIPILLCMERHIFAKHGLEVVHRVVPEGTGKMLDLLESREVDVALTVTDGFIAGKAAGRRVNLAGVFVESPLIWAVAVSAQAPSGVALNQLADLIPSKKLGALPNKCRFGISRLGSGSHTMAIYTGKHLLNLDRSSLEFVVTNNINGLRDGVHTDKFDAFMWETFTTKPLFDAGELKKLGEVVTPWPAFSFVSSAHMEKDMQLSLKRRLFPALAEGVALFVGGGDDMIQRICQEHGHTEKDARLWMSSCKYAVNEGVAPMAIKRAAMTFAIDVLREADLVPGGYDAQDLWQGNEASTII